LNGTSYASDIVGVSQATNAPPDVF